MQMMHSIACEHNKHSLELAQLYFSKRFMPNWGEWYTQGSSSHGSSNASSAAMHKGDYVQRMLQQIDNPMLGGYRLFWVLQDEVSCKFYSIEW